MAQRVLSNFSIILISHTLGFVSSYLFLIAKLLQNCNPY
jgi:hypothetical protein